MKWSANVYSTLWVKKTGPRNCCKLCPILIILLLLLTEIICPQIHNWISHFTYSLFLHYLEKCNCIHFFTKTVKWICNACGKTSLLLESRKFWWYLLLTSLMLLHDVIMTLCCCQRYAESINQSISFFIGVSGNDFVFLSRTVRRHTAASRNAKLSGAQPVAFKQPRSQFCGLRDLGCRHAALCLP